MRYFWFVIFMLSVGSVSAQNSARVRELEKQRKAALAEIEMTSQLLDETRQTARNSLNRLNLLSKQILSRKQVISLLNQEIGEIDKQIAASRRNISQLEKSWGISGRITGNRFKAYTNAAVRRISCCLSFPPTILPSPFAVCVTFASMPTGRRSRLPKLSVSRRKLPASRKNWKRHVPRRTPYWVRGRMKVVSSRPRNRARKKRCSS